MRRNLAIVDLSCDDCGLPRDMSADAIASNAPCPYCGHTRATGDAGPADATGDLLHRAFYRMPLVSLQRLKMWLRATGEAPISYGLSLASAPTSQPLVAWIEQHDDEQSASVKATLSTMTEVLLSLYVISEESAPADQLDDVIVNVVGGRFDRLPLPSRGKCFCGHGKRYNKCHGRITK